MGCPQIPSISLDIVFVQDTQKTMNSFLDSCVKAIGNLIVHLPCLPRYRSGGIRLGLVAYHDSQQTTNANCAETLGPTADHEQFLHSLRLLKARQTITRPDSANYALYHALQTAVKLDWGTNTDKAIILFTYKRSRPLDASSLDIFNRLSKEQIHLYIANGMQVSDLFDDGDSALINNVRSLDVGIPVHLEAFISAGLRAHSTSRDAACTTNNYSPAAIVPFILWSWGCETDSCAQKKPDTSDSNTVACSANASSDKFLLPPALSSLPSVDSTRVVMHVAPRLGTSRWISTESDVDRSPTATLVTPLSPGFVANPEMNEQYEIAKCDPSASTIGKARNPIPEPNDGTEDNGCFSQSGPRQKPEGNAAEDHPTASRLHEARSIVAPPMTLCDPMGIEGGAEAEFCGRKGDLSITDLESENMDTVVSDAGCKSNTDEEKPVAPWLVPVNTAPQEEIQRVQEDRVNNVGEVDSFIETMPKLSGVDSGKLDTDGKSETPQSVRAAVADVGQATATSGGRDIIGASQGTSDPLKENVAHLPSSIYGGGDELENTQCGNATVPGSAIAEAKHDHMIDAVGVQVEVLGQRFTSKESAARATCNDSGQLTDSPLSEKVSSNVGGSSTCEISELRKHSSEVETDLAANPSLRIENNVLYTPPEKSKVTRRLLYSEVLKIGTKLVNVSDLARKVTNDAKPVEGNVPRCTESVPAFPELETLLPMRLFGMPNQESQLHDQSVTGASSKGENGTKSSSPLNIVLEGRSSDVPGIGTIDSQMFDQRSGSEGRRPEDVAVSHISASAPGSSVKSGVEVTLCSKNIASDHGSRASKSYASHVETTSTTMKAGHSFISEASWSDDRHSGVVDLQGAGSHMNYIGDSAHPSLSLTEQRVTDCIGRGRQQEGLEKEESAAHVYDSKAQTACPVAKHTSSRFEDSLTGKPTSNISGKPSILGSSSGKLEKCSSEEVTTSTRSTELRGHVNISSSLFESGSLEPNPRADAIAGTRKLHPTGSQSDENDLSSIVFREESAVPASGGSVLQVRFGIDDDGHAPETYGTTLFTPDSKRLDTEPYSNMEMVLSDPESRTLASASSDAISEPATSEKRRSLGSKSRTNIGDHAVTENRSDNPRYSREAIADYEQNQQPVSPPVREIEFPGLREPCPGSQSSSDSSDVPNAAAGAEDNDSPMVGTKDATSTSMKSLYSPDVISNDAKEEAVSTVLSIAQKVHRDSTSSDLASIKESISTQGVRGSPDTDSSKHAMQGWSDETRPTIENQAHDETSDTPSSMTDTTHATARESRPTRDISLYLDIKRDASNEVQSAQESHSSSCNEDGHDQQTEKDTTQPLQCKDQEQSSLRNKGLESPLPCVQEADSVSCDTSARGSKLNVSPLDHNLATKRPSRIGETAVEFQPGEIINRASMSSGKEMTRAVVTAAGGMTPSSRHLPSLPVPSSAVSLSRSESLQKRDNFETWPHESTTPEVERAGKSNATTVGLQTQSMIPHIPHLPTSKADVRRDSAPNKDFEKCSPLADVVFGQELPGTEFCAPTRSQVLLSTTNANPGNGPEKSRPTPEGSRSLPRPVHRQSKTSLSLTAIGNRGPGTSLPLASKDCDEPAPEVGLESKTGIVYTIATHDKTRGPVTPTDLRQGAPAFRGQDSVLKPQMCDDSSKECSHPNEINGTKKPHPGGSRSCQSNHCPSEAVPVTACSSQEKSAFTSVELCESQMEARPDTGFSGTAITRSSANVASTEYEPPVLVSINRTSVDTEENNIEAVPIIRVGHLVHGGDARVSETSSLSYDNSVYITASVKRKKLQEGDASQPTTDELGISPVVYCSSDTTNSEPLGCDGDNGIESSTEQGSHTLLSLASSASTETASEQGVSASNIVRSLPKAGVRNDNKESGNTRATKTVSLRTRGKDQLHIKATDADAPPLLKLKQSFSNPSSPSGIHERAPDASSLSSSSENEKLARGDDTNESTPEVPVASTPCSGSRDILGMADEIINVTNTSSESRASGNAAGNPDPARQFPSLTSTSANLPAHDHSKSSCQTLVTTLKSAESTLEPEGDEKNEVNRFDEPPLPTKPKAATRQSRDQYDGTLNERPSKAIQNTQPDKDSDIAETSQALDDSFAGVVLPQKIADEYSGNAPTLSPAASRTIPQAIPAHAEGNPGSASCNPELPGAPQPINSGISGPGAPLREKSLCVYTELTEPQAKQHGDRGSPGSQTTQDSGQGIPSGNVSPQISSSRTSDVSEKNPKTATKTNAEPEFGSDGQEPGDGAEDSPSHPEVVVRGAATGILVASKSTGIQVQQSLSQSTPTPDCMPTASTSATRKNLHREPDLTIGKAVDNGVADEAASFLDDCDHPNTSTLNSPGRDMTRSAGSSAKKGAVHRTVKKTNLPSSYPSNSEEEKDVSDTLGIPLMGDESLDKEDGSCIKAGRSDELNHSKEHEQNRPHATGEEAPSLPHTSQSDSNFGSNDISIITNEPDLGRLLNTPAKERPLRRVEMDASRTDKEKNPHHSGPKTRSTRDVPCPADETVHDRNILSKLRPVDVTSSSHASSIRSANALTKPCQKKGSLKVSPLELIPRGFESSRKGDEMKFDDPTKSPIPKSPSASSVRVDDEHNIATNKHSKHVPLRATQEPQFSAESGADSTSLDKDLVPVGLSNKYIANSVKNPNAQPPSTTVPQDDLGQVTDELKGSHDSGGAGHPNPGIGPRDRIHEVNVGEGAGGEGGDINNSSMSNTRSTRNVASRGEEYDLPTTAVPRRNPPADLNPLVHTAAMSYGYGPDKTNSVAAGVPHGFVQAGNNASKSTNSTGSKPPSTPSNQRRILSNFRFSTRPDTGVDGRKNKGPEERLIDSRSIRARDDLKRTGVLLPKEAAVFPDNYSKTQRPSTTSVNGLIPRKDSLANPKMRSPILRQEASPTLVNTLKSRFEQMGQTKLGATSTMPATGPGNASQRPRPQLFAKADSEQNTFLSLAGSSERSLLKSQNILDPQSETHAAKVAATALDALTQPLPTPLLSGLTDSSTSDNNSSSGSMAPNYGAAPISIEEQKIKAKQARVMLNEELKRTPVTDLSHKVPFDPGVELGEKPINREQTRRVVLEALMAFARVSAE